MTTTNTDATIDKLGPRSERRPLMRECMDELTGFDELAIEKRYGAIIELLAGAKYMRALAFSQELHAGTKEPEAYKKITGLTQAQLSEYFSALPDDDVDEDEEGGDGAHDHAATEPNDGGQSGDGPGPSHEL